MGQKGQGNNNSQNNNSQEKEKIVVKKTEKKIDINLFDDLLNEDDSASGNDKEKNKKKKLEANKIPTYEIIEEEYGILKEKKDKKEKNHSINDTSSEISQLEELENEELEKRDEEISNENDLESMLIDSVEDLKKEELIETTDFENKEISEEELDDKLGEKEEDINKDQKLKSVPNNEGIIDIDLDEIDDDGNIIDDKKPLEEDKVVSESEGNAFLDDDFIEDEPQLEEIKEEPVKNDAISELEELEKEELEKHDEEISNENDLDSMVIDSVEDLKKEESKETIDFENKEVSEEELDDKLDEKEGPEKKEDAPKIENNDEPEKKEDAPAVENSEEPKKDDVAPKENKAEIAPVAHETLPEPTPFGSDLLPKAQKNLLSSSIDVFNKNNGTAFSTRGISNYLEHEFKSGKGETLGDQRESFKQSYSEFMKQAYANMLDKRLKMDPSKRQPLENTLEDFDKFSKQVANMAKANGWMKKDYEIGPNGGLSPETIRKIQKDSLSKGPKDAKEFAQQKLITNKNQYQNAKQFEKSYLEEIDKVPQADKDANFSPEATHAITGLQALNEVHANRGLKYKLAHPFAYRKEGKTLNKAQKALEKKGYNKEIISTMLKDKVTEQNDTIKQANDNESKEIEESYKKNKERTQKFEERKEKEEREIQKQIKGIRKRITVPEADNTKELVNPKEKSPKIQPKLELQKTNDLQFQGGSK